MAHGDRIICLSNVKSIFTIYFKSVTLIAVESLVLIVANFIICTILVTWLHFFLYSRRSLKCSPKLEEKIRSPDSRTEHHPLVSVIIPALNEEKYICRCLRSLLAQDYPNFEILTIDDGSMDGTYKLMETIASGDRRLRVFRAGPRPFGWVGKNWPCFVGYNKSFGEILLFTDADTVHSKSTVTLAVDHMIHEKLSSITATPRLLFGDLLTGITLPLLLVFLQTRFSPLKVNDPSNRMGYFFGSFFAITRGDYEAIGTHMEVRAEIIEDGAIGANVKRTGFRMKMFRGENNISALWARDRQTLWNGLLRLLITMHREQGKKTYAIGIAIAFLMLFPFIAVTIGAVFIYQGNPDPLDLLFLLAAFLTVGLIAATSDLNLSESVKARRLFASASPVGAVLIFMSFVVSMLKARRQKSFTWKGRNY